MWSDRVSNPGPLTHESDALLTVLHGPASGTDCSTWPGLWALGEEKHLLLWSINITLRVDLINKGGI